MAAGIAGCATPAEKKTAAIKAWTSDSNAKIASGQMTQLDKLKGMYDILRRPPVTATDAAAMRWTAANIDTLEALQSGTITRQQADSRMRQSETDFETNNAHNSVQTNCYRWQNYVNCTSQ